MTPAFKNLITDPTNRNSTLHEIEYRDSEYDNLLKLLGVRAKTSLAIGGPRKLIGLETELSQIENATTNNTTKLVIVKGAAGMGKSRLVHEAIQKLPYSIICSFDPSGEKIPGHGLMTITEQIFEQIRSTEGLENSNPTRELGKFDRLSQKAKIQLAQKNPGKIIKLCKEALRLMNNGRISFVLDDLHHSDRHSMAPILNLLYHHINHNEGKAMVLLRPEEIHHPKALNQLETKVKAVYSKNKSVETVNLTGLDFINDHSLAHDFVFFSLPENLQD